MNMVNTSWILQAVIDALASIGLGRELALRVFTGLLVLAIGFLLVKVLTRFSAKVLFKLYPRQVTLIVSRLIYYTLLFIVVVTFLGVLGVDVSGLVIAGGFAGLVVGVALQPVLSNVFAGLYIIAEKAVQPGDAVEIGGVSGEVIALSIMFTRIRTWDGVVVTLPNNMLLSSSFKNYSRTVAKRVEVSIPIAYSGDAEMAYSVVREALGKLTYVLVEPAPDIFVSSIVDGGLNLTVRAWVLDKYYYTAIKELPWAITKALKASGIEIQPPRLDIRLKSIPEPRSGNPVESSGLKTR